MATPENDVIRVKLSGWIWNQNSNLGILKINEQTPRDDLPFIRLDRFDSLKQNSLPDVGKRIKKLASCIFRLTGGKAGEYLPIKSFDSKKIQNKPTDEANFMCAASYCENFEELNFLLKSMEEDGLIKIHQKRDKSDSETVCLTTKGHSSVQQPERGQDSKQVFVAMWLDDRMKKAKEAIKRSIEEAGYKPLVIDEVEHNEDITGKIIEEIKKSRFVVADFTCPLSESEKKEPHIRGSVYYEAGFAKGLNIPVIHTCQKECHKSGALHFDIRQINHIIWDSENGLYESLKRRIAVLITENDTDAV